jgi:hypothetical protein
MNDAIRGLQRTAFESLRQWLDRLQEIDQSLLAQDELDCLKRYIGIAQDAIKSGIRRSSSPNPKD